MKQHLNFFVTTLLKMFVATVIASFPLSYVRIWLQHSSEVVKAIITIVVFVTVYMVIYDLFFTRRKYRVLIKQTKPENISEVSRDYFKEYVRKETLVHAVVLVPLGLITFFVWFLSGIKDYASIATMGVAFLFPLVSCCILKRRIAKDTKRSLKCRKRKDITGTVDETPQGK